MIAGIFGSDKTMSTLRGLMIQNVHVALFTVLLYCAASVAQHDFRGHGETGLR